MKYLSLIFLFLFNFTAHATEQKKIEDDDQWYKKIETLNWQNLEEKEHYKEIIKAKADVLILEDEIYLSNYKDINQYNWWTSGISADKDSVMLIRGNDYNIYLDYIDDGYIKLDDWSKVSADDLLSQMRDTAKSNIKFFKERNLDYTTQIEWIFKPTLNKENSSVSYSYKVTWNSGNITMESKNLILGKKGHLESAYVVSYDKDLNFKIHSDFSKDFVNGVIFKEGFTHSDYKPGDKLAAVGIGGLVAGSLGVKALAKSGILLKLAKFWWVLLAPLAFMGKFLSGKESSSSSRGRRRRE